MGKQVAFTAKYAVCIRYNLILISGEESSRVNKVCTAFCRDVSVECLKNATKSERQAQGEQRLTMPGQWHCKQSARRDSPAPAMSHSQGHCKEAVCRAHAVTWCGDAPTLRPQSAVCQLHPGTFQLAAEKTLAPLPGSHLGHDYAK